MVSYFSKISRFKFLNNKIFLISSSIILVVFGIIVMFSNIRHCEFTGDETYQMICIKYFRQAPLAMATFFNGHIWTSILGFSFISLRVLCRICYIIAIGISIIFLYKKTGNIILSSSVFITSCFIVSIGSFGIYNWDTGAYPIETIGIILLLLYIQKPSILLAIALGIAAGIMTCTRLPLVLFSVIVLFIMIQTYREGNINSKTIFCHAAIGLSIMCITILASGWIMTGSIAVYVRSFNPDNFISGHGYKDLGVLIWRFKMVFPFVCVSMTPVALCYMYAKWTIDDTKKNIKNNWYAIIGFSCLCIMLGWSVLRVIVLHDTYDQPIFGLGIFLVIIPSFVYPFIILKHHNIDTKTYQLVRMQSTAIILMLFLLGIGSDTPFERLNVSFLMPLSFGVLWSVIQKHDKSIIKAWLAYCLLTFVSIWGYKSYAISKDYISTPEQTPLRQHIPTPMSGHEIYTDFPNDLRTIVKDNDYSVWGSYRYYILLAYNKEPEYSIHLFHYGGEDITKVYPLVIKKKYVFLTHWPEYKEDMTKSLKSLKEQGFKILKETSTYILLENERLSE